MTKPTALTPSSAYPLVPSRPAARRLVLVVVLALLGIAASARAATTVALRGPSHPTWKDEVVVRITGTTPDGCGVSAGDVGRSLSGGSVRLQIPLSTDCTSAQLGENPFVLDVNLGHLEPHDYVVAVGHPSATLAETRFTVYFSGQVELVLPAVARDDAPLDLAVRGYWSCPWVEEARVEGTLVTLVVDAECHILPPGPGVFAIQPDVPVGPVPAGDYEVVVVDRAMMPFDSDPPAIVRGSLRVWDADGCVPSDTSLCLHGGRFRVTATWTDFAGASGAGHAAPSSGNETAGQMWFFTPDNTELSVKVLDACANNHRWWVFVSPASTVEFVVTVLDTTTGAQLQLTNESGVASPLMAVTDAFACP